MGMGHMRQRIDLSPRHKNSGRPPEKDAPGFLQWIRTKNCLLAGNKKAGPCWGKIRACHVDYAGGKGVATKVADRFSVPMCDGHHDEQHKGWQTFERKHDLDALDASIKFWFAWPGRRDWERKNGIT